VRILHVIASLAARYGGPSVAALGMAKAMQQRGHDVTIMTTNIDGDRRMAVPLGISTLHKEIPTIFYQGWPPQSFKPSPGLAQGLWRAIPTYDVVHIHSIYLFHTAVAARFSRRQGIPYIIRPHGGLDPYHAAHHPGRKRLYERFIESGNLRAAAIIHCTAEQERKAVKAWDPQLRCAVVSLGVDVPNADHTDRTDAGPPTILFLGRMTSKKRPDLVLEAFATLAVDQPALRLVLAGPDDDGLLPGLKARARQLGVAGQVECPGMVTGRAKQLLLRQATVFVLPSEDENFGVSAVEAMAAAVPVVLSPGVAVGPEVAAAGAGLVKPRDTVSLAAGLRQLLADDGRRAAMGLRARQLVERRYTWAAVAPALEQLYLDAIASTRKSPS
jgi:glycosyltransferase involved in cell wall biosynthesis